MRTRPVVDRLEAEFGARVDFIRYNIDATASQAAMRQYRFRAQPQIVIVDVEGAVVFSRLSQLTYVQLKQDLLHVLAQ
jgi:hypothetical protein